MSKLWGTYNSTLDPKGRVKLPSSLLKQFAEGTTEFVLVRGLDPCIRLFTFDAWDTYLEKVYQLSDFDPKARILKNVMLKGNNQVELDASERILIPKVLIELGKLEKELTIVCQIDKVEIWDTNTYNAMFDDYTTGDLSALAAELLG
jgi:MraZ protein